MLNEEKNKKSEGVEDSNFSHWTRTDVFLPGWTSPVGPRLLTQHFVPFQARFVCLPERITCPSDPDVLQKTKVADLVAHQRIIENVCSLFVIGFDASGKGNQQGHLLVAPYTSTMIIVSLNHSLH